MDPFIKALLHPRFTPTPGRKVRWPFEDGPEITKLRPSQKKVADKLWRPEGFEGNPEENCHHPDGCNTPLGTSNHYLYCRRHLNSAQNDFVKRNPEKNPTKFLEILRRDR